MNNSYQTVYKYFEASNRKDFAVISSLLQEFCTYSSDNTGIFFGKGPILSMMKEFFSKYKNLYWTIDTLIELTDAIVEIHFTLASEDTHEIKSLKKGVERIVIQDGLIRHIEVRNKSI